MIYNIRGTSGSGKTYLVRQLVNRYMMDTIRDEHGKIFGYRLPRNLLVLGRYDDAIKGGGVDNITEPLYKRYLAHGWVGNSMDAVEAQVRKWAQLGHHVLFEGIIVTSVWGRWVKLAADEPVHFLFLDTPLEVCYQRVLERSGGRSPKGWAEGKSDLHAKHSGTQKQLASIMRKDEEVKRRQSSMEDFHNRQHARHLPSAVTGGLHYTVLDYSQAFEQLVAILNEEIGFPLNAAGVVGGASGLGVVGG